MVCPTPLAFRAVRSSYPISTQKQGKLSANFPLAA